MLLLPCGICKPAKVSEASDKIAKKEDDVTEKLFQREKSAVYYNAGLLLTREIPLLRMGVKQANVYLIISVEDSEEVESASCLDAESETKVTNHVMHHTSELVAKMIANSGVPISFKSHIKDVHKMKTSKFQELRLSQNQGWLSSNLVTVPTALSTTVAPSSTTTTDTTTKEVIQNDETPSESYDADASQDNEDVGVVNTFYDVAVKDGDVESYEDEGGSEDNFWNLESYPTDVFTDTTLESKSTAADLDFDELELESHPLCCTRCHCRQFQLGTGETISFNEGVQSVAIQIRGMDLTKVNVHEVDNRPDFAWLITGPKLVVVVGIQLQDQALPEMKMASNEIKLIFGLPTTEVILHVKVEQCLLCEETARLTFEKASNQGKHRPPRNAMTDFLGALDAKTFYTEVKKLHQQAEADRHTIEVEENNIRDELRKAKVARHHVSNLVGTVAARICKESAKVEALQMQMELKLHAMAITNHVMNEIQLCQMDKIPSMITSEKIKTLCSAEYPDLCDNMFLNMFQRASSCQVMAVMMDTKNIVIKVVLDYPKGPSIRYDARRITVIPVFNRFGNETAVLNVAKDAVLIQTSRDHLTVISDCSIQAVSGQSMMTCDIENHDSRGSRCIQELLNNSGNIVGDLRDKCITKSPVVQDCFVKRIAEMLFVSSKVALPIIQTDTVALHGFIDNTRQKEIPSGVSLIDKSTASAVSCRDFTFETRYADVMIDINELDHFSESLNLNFDIIEKITMDDQEDEDPERKGMFMFTPQDWYEENKEIAHGIGIGSIVILILLCILGVYILKYTAVGIKAVTNICTSIRRCCPCLRTKLRFNGEPNGASGSADSKYVSGATGGKYESTEMR